MIRIENEVLYYTAVGADEIEVGKIADGELSDGYFSLNGQGFPVERFPEIQQAWDVIYPNGKPKPDPGPVQPTELELVKAELEHQKALNSGMNQTVSDLMDILFTKVPELTEL